MGGKFANGAYTAAFQHLLHAEIGPGLAAAAARNRVNSYLQTFRSALAADPNAVLNLQSHLYRQPCGFVQQPLARGFEVVGIQLDAGEVL